MTLSRYSIILILSLCTLPSCDQLNILNYLDIENKNNDDQTKDKKYFDIQGFINESIEKMGKQSIVISKVMAFDNKIDSLETTRLDLKKELLFLEILDINKKKYKDKFKTARELLKNGKIVWVYKQDRNEKLIEPIYQLNIEFYDRDLDVSKISAHLFFVNILYVKKEIIEMKFDKNGIIESYNIDGGSKMIGQDSTKYNVNVNFKINNEL